LEKAGTSRRRRWTVETDRARRIDALLGEVDAVSRDEAAALAVKVAALQKALDLRAVRPADPAPTPPRLLTLKEVAERSRKSRRWWNEHWRAEIGAFAIPMGRTNLFPEDAFEAWLRRT